MRIDMNDRDAISAAVSPIRDRVEFVTAADQWTDDDVRQCLADRWTLLRIVDELEERERHWMACCMESDEAGSLADEARKLAEKRAENCKAIVVAQEQTIRELSHKLDHMRDGATVIAASMEAHAKRHFCDGLDCRRCNPRHIIHQLRCSVGDCR